MAPNKLAKEEHDQAAKTKKEEEDQAAKTKKEEEDAKKKAEHALGSTSHAAAPEGTTNADVTDTTYPYYKYIRSPAELGISSNGSLAALSNDITGLIAYTELLIEGQSKASATGGPLGNKFFLTTNSKCIDKATNQPVERYIYLSNIPDGNIPLLSSAAGGNFSQFEGLIPGILTSLNNLSVPDPSEIFQTFENGGIPCQQVTMEVVDIDNNRNQESRYVAVTDLQNMDNCLFNDKRNPVTGQKCSEFFSNNINKPMARIPNDIAVQTYLLIFGIVIIYFLLKILFDA
jgi:hypothetical protein